MGVWKYDGTNWTNTGGAFPSGAGSGINSLAYDSGHNLLYASTWCPGEVWKYNGSVWTNTGVSSYMNIVDSLAYDSGHNLLYAGTDVGVWEYDGAGWTNTGGVVV